MAADDSSALQLEADCLCEFKNMGVMSWNTSDPCTFSTPCEVALSGVYCWADGHLRDLNLNAELEMQGSFPSCISAFGKIASLLIQLSEISGTLPPAFYNLTTLTTLALSYNLMEGTIAPQLSQFVNLESLSLLGVLFQGPILDYLVDISTLRLIVLSQNRFTGTIPSDISRMENLGHLEIESNYFTGDIPTSFCSLQALRILLLEDTPVTGQIPACLATLPHLSVLNLEGTYVYGDTSAFANISTCGFSDSCVDCSAAPPNCLCEDVFPKPPAVCSCVSAGSCYIDTVCYGPGIPPPSLDCTRGCLPSSDALLWSDICDSVVPDEQPKVTFGLQLSYPECKKTLPSTFGAQFSQDIAISLAVSSDSVYVNSITLWLDSSCNDVVVDKDITVILTEVQVNYTVLCQGDYSTEEIILSMENLVADENSVLYQGNVCLYMHSIGSNHAYPQLI
ncbi:Leucine-rich repeat receptor protein kinase TDR [Pelomyxa schiedti]|nr:Leucine-rich repeat receptor protein kinase TDR [Pelomyxa schiedti]